LSSRTVILAVAVVSVSFVTDKRLMPMPQSLP